MRLINWELAHEPVNWIMVIVIMAFPLLLVSIINPLQPPASGGSPTSGGT